MSKQEEKRALRKRMRQTLLHWLSEAPSPAPTASAACCHLIEQLPEFTQADTVLAYMALSEEADCSALIEAAAQHGKQVALPRVQPGTSDMDFFLLDKTAPLSTQTTVGAWGIQEPLTTLRRFELETAAGRIFMIVPGVAFSSDGARLGHGKGFYDRYIARLAHSAASVCLCGFCFSVQCVAQVPTDCYDRRMDIVVTECELVRCI